MRAILGLIVAGIGLWGCGKSPQNPPAAASDQSAGGEAAKKTYVIGVVAKSRSNQVFQAAWKGAKDAARDLSKKYDAQISINWRTPNNEDAQQQAQFVEQLTSQGVDGLAISVSDANILTDAIRGAVDQGVVVVCFDSDAPQSGRMAYYGVDDVAAGRKVMEELAAQMGGQGTVAILAGNQSAPNLQARVQGVKEEAAKSPGITIRDVYYHPETATDAAAKMQAVQTNDPEIAGWALVGGWPLYTDNALDGIYEHAKVVSMDPLPLPLEYVKKGQVQVLVGQPYYGWGYESVRMIVEKLIEDKDPPGQFVYADFDIVTADNVAEYEGRWERWLKDNN